MKNIVKILILFEMALLFSPTIGLIFIGYKHLDKPYEIFQTGENIPIGAGYILILLFATLGIIGVLSVLIKLFFKNLTVLPAKLTLTFLGTALLAILYGLYWFIVNDIRWEIVAGVAIWPLLGIIHAVYLGREYLFGISANNNSNSSK